MRTNDAYEALLAHARETEALSQVAGLLSWDQEAAMPRKGADARSEQAGAMSSVIHARNSDPRVAEWLDAVDGADLDAVGHANVRLIRRSHDRATRVPADLTAEIARTTMRAHQTWAAARESSNVAEFLPTLEQVIGLVREQARCLAGEGQDAYDALISIYEPGASSASISEVFGRLRTGLVELRGRIAESGAKVQELNGTFSKEGQLELARALTATLGYDFDAGRLDLVVHPFCSGTRGDTRITTRVDDADPFNCLYSTIHETGHALYEQGLDPALAWQPAGGHASMGVHESQSRLCENQIGRSAAFAEYLFPLMKDAFPDFDLSSADALYRAANRVSAGYIRTEADEVQYNLHIMLRFELERALIGGDLQVKDLEASWNDRFRTDFGREVDVAANGVLQDVHWSAGLFGYFPTYALGNIYAAELFAAMQTEIVGLDGMIARGELGAAVAWLRQNVHRQGAVLEPTGVIAKACGHEPTEEPLLAYLNAKFGALYGV